MQCTGACRALSASADNYVMFFVAGLFAYHGSVYFLSDNRILRFIKALSVAGLYQRLTFAAISCLMAVAWLVALEYVIQFYVPEFQISNLAGFPVAFLVLLSLGLFCLYIRDNFTVWRISAAIFMPMLQVAALHFYIISDFRQCIPLPMLYVMIPAVIATLIWHHIAPVITGRHNGPSSAHGHNKSHHQDHINPQTHHHSHHHRRPTQEPTTRFDYSDFNWNYLDHPLIRNDDTASYSSRDSYR